MALWCRDLKTVSVPRSRVPKAVTLVVPYYENPLFLQRQLTHWDETYKPSLQSALQIIVVDDGSPDHPAADYAPKSLHYDVTVRFFRIDVDVRWNWLAARNIGMHHAASDWCLMTDIDHVVPADTLEACVYGVHDPRVVYAFQRREHTGEGIAPHSASFFVHRSTFWKTGGYDETLSGYYGTDGDFRRRIARVAPIVLTAESLVRHEFVADSSTQRYLRKQPQDAAVRALVAARKPGWTPKVLSFPYHEVPASRQEVA